MATETNLTMERGDSQAFTVTALLNQAPIDLTGASMTFTACRSYVNPIIFQKTTSMGGGIVIAMDPTTGVAVVTLAPGDTTVLPNEDTALVYSCRVTTASGAEYTVAEGTLTVMAVAGV